MKTAKSENKISLEGMFTKGDWINTRFYIPKMITVVVPSPTSSSWARESSNMLLAAGWLTSISRKIAFPSFVKTMDPMHVSLVKLVYQCYNMGIHWGEPSKSKDSQFKQNTVRRMLKLTGGGQNHLKHWLRTQGGSDNIGNSLKTIISKKAK